MSRHADHTDTALTAADVVAHLASPDQDLEARLVAASALRQLADALVRHDCGATVLLEIAGAAEQASSRLSAFPIRSRVETLRKLIGPNGAPHLGAFVDRPVAGGANPTAADVRFSKEGPSTVIAEAFLSPAHEAAPGRVHGGVLAALFDDVMGAVPHLVGTAAYTTALTVKFRAPTPVPGRVVLRAWLASENDKDLRIEAEAHHGDRLTATAEATFRVVDATRFLA